MGSLDELSREFAREHSERLWKQLVLPGGAGRPPPRAPGASWSSWCCARPSRRVAIKVPSWFGLDLSGDDSGFYARNFSLFALPALAAYFAWQRRAGRRVIGVVALLFVLGAVAANAYPLADDSQSVVLTAIHLPLALWLVVGVAYAGGDWRSGRRRMDFIRFTGEWLIYFVLIALGGGVLTAFTIGTFHAIGLDAEGFVQSWLLPCGAMAAVVVSAWLVEAKQSVVENMAPVLTRVFTPALRGRPAGLPGRHRSGPTTASTSTAMRSSSSTCCSSSCWACCCTPSPPATPRPSPGLFDRLQLALVVSALIIDVLVLVAITGRITEWGFSPNKTAALGENVILLANLAWSAWLFLGFVRGRIPFARLENWQTRYVVVYAVWAWTVVLAFPPVFGFA